MTHDRPHRLARPLAQALGVVREEAGKQFDPRIVEAALTISVTRWAELLEIAPVGAPALVASTA